MIILSMKSTQHTSTNWSPNQPQKVSITSPHNISSVHYFNSAPIFSPKNSNSINRTMRRGKRKTTSFSVRTSLKWEKSWADLARSKQQDNMQSPKRSSTSNHSSLNATRRSIAFISNKNIFLIFPISSCSISSSKAII